MPPVAIPRKGRAALRRRVDATGFRRTGAQLTAVL
jgi:hypothetical protein